MTSPLRPIVWRESTRNRHIGSLDGNDVCEVVRPQKHRRNGTKFPWTIITLHDQYTWSQTFNNHDDRDLESSKSAAEARARWAIAVLYKSLREQS